MYNLFTPWFKVTSNITRKHDFSTKTRGIDFVTKSRFLFHYSLKINYTKCFVCDKIYTGQFYE